MNLFNVEKNIKFNNKKDTMYLSNLNDLKKRKINYTNEKYNFKEDFRNKKLIIKDYNRNNNDDIEKSKPITNIKLKVNKPNYNLKNDDIEDSKPNINKFKSKRKEFNPLNPDYRLPKIKEDKPIISKFIKDSLYIKDIPGTQIKTYHNKNIQSDIFKSVNLKKRRNYKKPNYILDVKDINKDQIFVSKKNTNPLNPTYIIRDDKKNLIKIGTIEKNYPKKNFLEVKKNYDKLKNNDIEGTNTNSIKYRIFNEKNRKYFNKTNDISDIIGAKNDTLKKGIIRKNPINNLVPNYNKYYKPNPLNRQNFLVFDEEKNRKNLPSYINYINKSEIIVNSNKL